MMSLCFVFTARWAYLKGLTYRTVLLTFVLYTSLLASDIAHDNETGMKVRLCIV